MFAIAAWLLSNQNCCVDSYSGKVDPVSTAPRINVRFFQVRNLSVELF